MNMIYALPNSASHAMTSSANGATGSSSSSSSASSASNQLSGNSFITLLTAQLQAQDPMDPMDPNQMMGELVSMNSLQQLIGIKQDLDSLSGATTGNGSSATGSS